ncbi:Transcriptional activator [Kitasatospora sp. MMS16-BH015]|uniref:AfsR/SARP family transcriptional regulator n=1 Tax=Kitasatospora sp. MMS16-BH015 TaxID=2018025 RepID=UPI000CA3A15A|nr:BTAD domain-containing putative transcriptional regulator [Kitasatospora sp. MMS16-BH015]AUG78727.1 Transcriptional activator [Kitasatospora sp. MMS16-BH015]
MSAATSRGAQEGQEAAEFAVLGSLEIRSGGESVLVSGALQRRVLVMLLLEAGRVVPVSRLVAAGWNEDPPDSAEHQVRKTVAKLRGRIPRGPELILTDGPGYRAVVGPDQLDLLRHQQLLTQAREALEAGDPGQAVARFRAALALWRGPVLSGAGGPVIDAASTALEEQRLGAAEQLYDLCIEAGEAAAVTGELRRLVEDHPLRESLRSRLMLALYHSGQQAAALDEFARARRHLAEELGIDPGAELTELQERILRQNLSPAQRPAAVVTAPAAAEAPYALPFDVRDFSGRGTELQWVAEAAERAVPGISTVLALDGMGGSGKTALAVRAAHLLAARYPDGCLFIDLHGFTPGQHPLSAFHAQGDLLAAAGIPSEEIPTVPAGRAARWQSFVRGRRLLLVLDNAASSEQVRGLLPAASDSLVLVTSRPRLTGLDGVRWRSVGALPEPDSKEILRNTLGPERVAREPEAARELLRLCGGLPLAVRIAAARLANRPHWTVQHLVERLRDHSRRLDELTSEGRGVAGALLLSYQSMPAEQRTAFRLLGHHPGRYLDAAEAAALLDTDVLTAEDVLEELVDVRLLEAREPGVYALHDLVRSFVQRVAQAEKATEDGQAVRRLLDHYVLMAERAGDVLFPGRRRYREDGEEQPAEPAGPAFDHKDKALLWLDQHRDGMLAAVDAAYTEGLYWHAARLPRELGFHSSIRAYDASANAALEKAVAASRRLGDRSLTRLNLTNLGMGMWRLGRLSDAVARLEEAAELSRQMADDLSEAACQARLGQAYNSMGELERALELNQEVNRRARELGLTRLDGSSLSMLGLIKVRMGRFEEAAEAAERAVAIFDSIQEVPLSVDALSNLSLAVEGLGRHEEALERAEEALERCERINLPSVLPLVLARRADALVRLGRLAEAADSADHALARAAGSIDDIHRAAVHLTVGRVRYAQGELAPARAQQLLAHEIACRMELRYDEACALRGLARTTGAQGDFVLARRHQASAERLFTLMKVPETAW